MNPLQAREPQITNNVDWVTVMLYIACVMMGWLNVYAAVYSPEEQTSIFDMSTNAGKQLMWIGTAGLLIICILVINYRFWDTFAFVIYGLVILLLLLVLVAGTPIKGSRSWFKIGSFSLQPAEFSKLATALALARYIDYPGVSLTKLKDQLWCAAIIGLPAVLIIASNETGSMLVFASFVIMLYREGLPGIYPLIGIVIIALFILTLFIPQLYIMGVIVVLTGGAFFLLPHYQRSVQNVLAIVISGVLMIGVVAGVDFFVNDVLQPHQQKRIKVLINPGIDPRGVGWNVTQAKIAIGSGRLWGKGFLEGTQTKFDFVPEQSTDFIFCTVGEEHGFVGSVIVVGLFLMLLIRIILLAEKQRTRFARVYGYCVAGIFFFHLMINIGMTVGLMPVIGIPLPYFSYGGSSLWSFSILLFIFLKLDSRRSSMFSRV
ncbi:rod shape-determining protein RodA [Tellurirhabdus bombi]|uniref:rod shape-determining protein RodA n=1 Tax=Tellurirhabdus bombi TaxID=2907205 RepID=UPI0021056549|nr:rod shape-determining protein RodA [Tellurirhabdus bombi]